MIYLNDSELLRGLIDDMKGKMEPYIKEKALEQFQEEKEFAEVKIDDKLKEKMLASLEEKILEKLIKHFSEVLLRGVRMGRP